MSEKELDQIRGNELTMIFQDPLTVPEPGVYDREPDDGEYPHPYASVKKGSRSAGRVAA